MNGFRDAVGKLADYQVILNATGWFDKGVLNEEDLAELNALIELKNTPPVEPEPGISLEQRAADMEEALGILGVEPTEEDIPTEESDDPSADAGEIPEPEISEEEES